MLGVKKTSTLAAIRWPNGRPASQCEPVFNAYYFLRPIVHDLYVWKLMKISISLPFFLPIYVKLIRYMPQQNRPFRFHTIYNCEICSSNTQHQYQHHTIQKWSHFEQQMKKKPYASNIYISIAWLMINKLVPCLKRTHSKWMMTLKIKRNATMQFMQQQIESFPSIRGILSSLVVPFKLKSSSEDETSNTHISSRQTFPSAQAHDGV